MIEWPIGVAIGATLIGWSAYLGRWCGKREGAEKRMDDRYEKIESALYDKDGDSKLELMRTDCAVMKRDLDSMNKVLNNGLVQRMDKIERKIDRLGGHDG